MVRMKKVKKGKYQVAIGCKNCKKESKVNIPKGMTIEKYLEENDTCGNCGCKTLFKY